MPAPQGIGFKANELWVIHKGGRGGEWGGLGCVGGPGGPVRLRGSIEQSGREILAVTSESPLVIASQCLMRTFEIDEEVG